MDATQILAIFLMFIATSNCMPADDIEKDEFEKIKNEFLELLEEKRDGDSHEQEDSHEQSGQTLDFQCDYGNWISEVECDHDHNDRKWSVECSSHGLGQEYTQSTSDYINDENELMGYQCPNNGFIKGLYSAHENGNLRWKVTCASVQGKCPTSCEYSDPIGWNDNVDFEVPSDMGLRGMVSDNGADPANGRYLWESCKYVDC